MTEEEIHLMCRKFSIIKYSINSEGLVDVDGDVNLSNYNITTMPIKFGRVNGKFVCSSCRLINLEGAPSHVELDFHCQRNNLVNLIGSPIYVGYEFDCYTNELTTLEGAPVYVGGDFLCDNNKLTNLYGSPRYVGENYECENNPLTSYDGISDYIGGDFFCGEFLISGELIREKPEILTDKHLRKILL